MLESLILSISKYQNVYSMKYWNDITKSLLNNSR